MENIRNIINKIKEWERKNTGKRLDYLSSKIDEESKLEQADPYFRDKINTHYKSAIKWAQKLNLEITPFEERVKLARKTGYLQ